MWVEKALYSADDFQWGIAAVRAMNSGDSCVEERRLGKQWGVL